MGFLPPLQHSSVVGFDIQDPICGQETQMRLGKCQPPTASLPINHGHMTGHTSDKERRAGRPRARLQPCCTPKLALWRRGAGSPSRSRKFLPVLKRQKELEKRMFRGWFYGTVIRAQTQDRDHLQLHHVPIAGPPSKWLNLSVPQFPQLQSQHNNRTYTPRWLEGLRT